MSRYRQAICVSLAGAPIMTGLMLASGSTLSTSLVFGFVTVVIALSGLHFGLWVKNNN